MQILIVIPNEKSEKLIRQMKLDRNFRECKIIELPKENELNILAMKSLIHLQKAGNMKGEGEEYDT